MKMQRLLLVFFLVFLATGVATSCPVCYGEADPNTASAVNAAIFSLLLVVGAVLSFFATLIFQIRKRMRLNAVDHSNETL